MILELPYISVYGVWTLNCHNYVENLLLEILLFPVEIIAVIENRLIKFGLSERLLFSKINLAFSVFIELTGDPE